jgi:acetyltransferase-like isoleucine patch superfamily enzyme
MKLAKILGVKLGENCNLATKEWDSEPYLVSLGNNVHTSHNVNFVTHDGSMRVIRNLYPEYKNADLFGRINIGNNVFIGINTTILPNTTIDDNVIIGAGSLVKGHYKSNSVYGGVPAKYICSIEEYKEKNKDKFDDTKHMNKKQKKLYLYKKYNLN